MSDGGSDASLELVQTSLTLSMPVLSMAPLRRWFLSMPVHPPAPLASFQTPSLLNLAALPTTRPRAPWACACLLYTSPSPRDPE